MLAKRLAIAIGLVAMGLTSMTVAPAARAGEFKLPDPNDYCTTPNILENLKRDVDSSFRGYSKTRLQLLEIIDPREHFARDRDETRTVQRKWCYAKARMSDNTVRDMWYLLEKPWGLAGIPVLSSTEFCIAGLDRWKVYGKDCSTIRNSIGW